MPDPIARAFDLLEPAARGTVMFLTGAGVSAESGIPTFRGPEGYWRVGSREYRPMELATREAFRAHPDDVWGWYLYRRGVCHAALPNAAHTAIARLDRVLGNRLWLVTQNVDGLHARAGHARERTFEIHGDIDFMRCARACTGHVDPIPEGVAIEWAKDRLPDAREQAALTCPRCGARARPHVLWFDEYYDETLFRAESALRAALASDLLLVVGSSGATNLPTQICMLAYRRGIPMIVIDPEPTPFTELAEASPLGCHLVGPACTLVPELAARLEALAAPARS